MTTIEALEEFANALVDLSGKAQEVVPLFLDEPQYMSLVKDLKTRERNPSGASPQSYIWMKVLTTSGTTFKIYNKYHLESLTRFLQE